MRLILCVIHTYKQWQHKHFWTTEALVDSVMEDEHRSMLWCNWTVCFAVEWTPWVSVWEEVNSQTSRLSIHVSRSKKHSLLRADDDHAVWKLYRLLNGLRGPSGHENYAARELCKLSSQVKKQTVHQKTEIWGIQVSDSSIMIVFLFSHALWPAPQAETCSQRLPSPTWTPSS